MRRTIRVLLGDESRLVGALHHDALMSVTQYFRISPQRAKEILKDVERAVKGWRNEGRAIGMAKNELDQFSEAFEHSERVAARRVLS